MTPCSSYLLCCTPRTGSWLLAEALGGTGIAGRPDEYFSHEKEIELAGQPLVPATDAVQRWLACIRSRGTTDNGVLGLKAHVDQLEHFIVRRLLLPDATPSSPGDVLQSTFPGLQLVWTRRRDKVRQAVSWYRSMYSGVWFKFAADKAAGVADSPPCNIRTIAMLHRRVLAQEAIWREFFSSCRLEPFVVDYEDLAASYVTGVEQVLDFLGLRMPAGQSVPPPRLMRQSDELSDEMVDRYQQSPERHRSDVTQ